MESKSKVFAQFPIINTTLSYKKQQDQQLRSSNNDNYSNNNNNIYEELNFIFPVAYKITYFLFSSFELFLMH